MSYTNDDRFARQALDAELRRQGLGNHAQAQTEMVLREHNPVNVMHDGPVSSAIQCICDWTWRHPRQHARHLAEALRADDQRQRNHA